MSYIITCYTLFDITQTGVINRSKPGEDVDPTIWLKQRNTQCNFDTILQVISLRSQPEIVSFPEEIKIKFDSLKQFGSALKLKKNEEITCWKFQFSIQHPSVFSDTGRELGALYDDCNKVPMILCNTQWDKLPAFLDTSPEFKNIYFTLQND